MAAPVAPTTRRFVRTDPAPDNFRALWDTIHQLRDDHTALQTTITQQASTITALQTSLASVKTIAQQAAVTAGKAVTTAPTGTGAPSTGPIIPPPGTVPPTPPNEPPLTGTLSTTDVIGIGGVTWEASQNVAAWPITTTLSAITWNTNGVSVTFDKQTGVGRWPDQSFGTGSIQYTLWAILNINGVYYGAAGIMYWFGLQYNGGPPSGFDANWFYASGTWGPLANVAPAYGSSVFLFVTAGPMRTNGTSSVQERSQIVQIQMPSNAGGVYTT